MSKNDVKIEEFKNIVSDIIAKGFTKNDIIESSRINRSAFFKILNGDNTPNDMQLKQLKSAQAECDARFMLDSKFQLRQQDIIFMLAQTLNETNKQNAILTEMLSSLKEQNEILMKMFNFKNIK